MSILEKFEKKEDYTFEDAVKLYDLELFELATLANKIREEKHGKKTYFNIN